MLNYNMIQMSGGDVSLNYDKERLFLKGHCMSREAADIFNLMVDTITEPRSEVVCEIAKSKCR